MNSVLTFLQSLLPLLGPELVQLWNNQLVPVLNKQIALMGADEQVACNALIAAVTTIITTEAPKI